MSASNLQTVHIEKVVPGGHALARHDGRIVLVRGAIPGELVRVRLERTGKGGVLFADVVEVIDASPDRIEPAGDPRCGGLAFAHVRYARQLGLKREMLEDALRRTGRLATVPPVDVMASPLEDWRLRARLHVDAGQVGFFREGTHTLCVPPVSQLPVRMREAARAVLHALPEALHADIVGLVVAENIAATAWSVHVDVREQARIPDWQATLPAGVVGLTMARAGRRDIGQTFGTPAFVEPLRALTGRDLDGSLGWQAAAFFQANRFIVPFLAQRVLQAIAAGPVVDLFAGVGLFGLSAAAAGHGPAWCVEGDPISGERLRVNAGPGPDAVHVCRQSVESFVARDAARLDGATVIVDPPRTGLPPTVCRALCDASTRRVVYVSCDAATFARDLRRLVEAGYALLGLDAFDMFPLTAHLETLAVLERGARLP